MKTGSLREVATALQAARTILVAGHQHPEGDALGSSLGLTLALRSIGKSTTLFNADACPRNLRFLPHIEDLLEHSLPPGPFDAVVLCDCAEPERIHADLLQRVQAETWIVLDHHRTEATFGTVVFQDEDAPATCAVILELLDILAVPIDQDIAACLYTGLAVDTGNFHYSNATLRAFQAATRLVEAGADAAAIATHLFEGRPLAAFHLLARVLDTLEVYDDGRIASIVLDPAMLADTGATVEDTLGLVDYPRALAGCAVAVQYSPLDDDRVRVSMRTSVSSVDVESVARVLGGGGHQHAAGCVVRAPLPQAKGVVMTEIRNMLQRVYGERRLVD